MRILRGYFKASLALSDKKVMTGPQSSSHKDRSSLIVVLLLLGAGFLLFQYLGEEAPKKDSRQLASPKGTTIKSNPAYEQSVNRHLMMTNEKVEMARQRMEVDNTRFKEFHETKAQTAYQSAEGVDLNGEGNAKSVAEDLGRGERKQSNSRSPHDVIQSELYNAQLNQAYTEEYRQEYARQFVENARRGGYKVQLDENYRVISVTPLRKPTQSLDLFEGEGSGKPLQ